METAAFREIVASQSLRRIDEKPRHAAVRSDGRKFRESSKNRPQPRGLGVRQIARTERGTRTPTGVVRLTKINRKYFET